MGHAGEIQTRKWQGMEVDERFLMKEQLNVHFRYAMERTRAATQQSISPDMPWAEMHFIERVSGQPLNPGNTYTIWPYYGGDKEIRGSGVFTHTYMERYFPKHANPTENDNDELRGIRYEYGDLGDVIAHMVDQPLTRQAYLPVWFPEDTGVLHKGRVPCTLGYHFIIRDGKLHCNYYIRSCDLVRHFKNDVYLTVRLVQHILAKLQADPKFNEIEPGFLNMYITSLHCFKAEYNQIKRTAQTIQ